MGGNNDSDLLDLRRHQVLMVGLDSAALAATAEYNNMDAMALARGVAVHTSCSIRADIGTKTYCFGSQQAMDMFMQNPNRNIRKSFAAYESMH